MKLKLLTLSFLSLALTACSGAEDTDDSDVGTDVEPGTDADSGTEVDDDTEAGEADVLFTALLAKNDTGDVDEAGDFDDWLEITNEGSVTADLSGWGLTDGYPDETPWRFPDDTLLDAGDTLRVWADEDPEDGPLHADFKLSGDGETLTMLDSEDNIIDEVTFPVLDDDEVYERQADGTWAIAE